MQDKPCEYIEVMPRGGIMVAKTSTYTDKIKRLVPGCRDANFANFDAEDDKYHVFLRGNLTDQMSLVDAPGNYTENFFQVQVRQSWEAQRARHEQDPTLGPFETPFPSVAFIPDAPVLAKDMALPPVAYPVEGFVEPVVSEASGSESGTDHATEDEASASVLSDGDFADDDGSLDANALVVDDDGTPHCEFEAQWRKSEAVLEATKRKLEEASNESNSTKSQRRDNMKLMMYLLESSDEDEE